MRESVVAAPYSIPTQRTGELPAVAEAPPLGVQQWNSVVLPIE
jgi:hypothetical protein